MKIIFYCQYVWGMGHLFRSIELARALAGHEVILVAGGQEIDVRLPQHVWVFPHRGCIVSPGLLLFMIKPLPPEMILLMLPLHSGQTSTGASCIDCVISNFLPQSSH